MSNEAAGLKNSEHLLTRLKRVRALARLKPFDTTTEEGRSQERYRRILWITASGLATRAITTVVGFVSIPLALSYLGKEKYGLWATITSFVAWTALFDFGIVNSLVNALSEANGKDDCEAARHYVSTAFFMLLAMSLVLGIAVTISARWVPWLRVFAVRFPIPASTVMWAVMAALICVLTALPLSVVRQIYAAYQKSYILNLSSGCGAVLTLLALYAVVWKNAGFAALIFAFAGPPVVITFVNLIYLTRREMPWLSPRIHNISRLALRRLVSISAPLFLFQLGALLVNETQMIVLAHVTSLKLVSEYSILWRLSIMPASLIALGTGAFVPAFREAHERGDCTWVKTSFRRMLALRMAFGMVAAIILILGGNPILRIWLHRSDFNFPISVWLAQCVSILGAIWVTSFSDLLTIMDRIWVQVVMVLINGATTIALTIFLAPRFGLLGAVIAIAFITICFWTWMLPLLVRPILTGTGTAATSRTATVASDVVL